MTTRVTKSGSCDQKQKTRCSDPMDTIYNATTVRADFHRFLTSHEVDMGLLIHAPNYWSFHQICWNISHGQQELWDRCREGFQRLHPEIFYLAYTMTNTESLRVYCSNSWKSLTSLFIPEPHHVTEPNIAGYIEDIGTYREEGVENTPEVSHQCRFVTLGMSLHHMISWWATYDLVRKFWRKLASDILVTCCVIRRPSIWKKLLSKQIWRDTGHCVRRTIVHNGKRNDKQDCEQAKKGA